MEERQTVFKNPNLSEDEKRKLLDQIRVKRKNNLKLVNDYGLKDFDNSPVSPIG